MALFVNGAGVVADIPAELAERLGWAPVRDSGNPTAKKPARKPAGKAGGKSEK